MGKGESSWQASLDPAFAPDHWVRALPPAPKLELQYRSTWAWPMFLDLAEYGSPGRTLLPGFLLGMKVPSRKLKPTTRPGGGTRQRTEILTASFNILKLWRIPRIGPGIYKRIAGAPIFWCNIGDVDADQQTTIDLPSYDSIYYRSLLQSSLALMPYLASV